MVWMAVEPLDMRAGTETPLARVIKVFGEARAQLIMRICSRIDARTA